MQRHKKRRQARSLSERGTRMTHQFSLPTRNNIGVPSTNTGGGLHNTRISTLEARLGSGLKYGQGVEPIDLEEGEIWVDTSEMVQNSGRLMIKVPEKHIPSFTIYLAFHVILNGDEDYARYTGAREKTSEFLATLNAALKVQFDIVGTHFDRTSESMKPYGDRDYTPGETEIKFNFEFVHFGGDDTIWYTSLRYPGDGLTPAFNPEWVNEGKMAEKMSMMGEGGGLNNSFAGVIDPLVLNARTTLNVYWMNPLGNPWGGGVASGPMMHGGDIPGTHVSLRHALGQRSSDAGLRILIHEMGHCLGLYHTWFQGGSVDHADDTPNHLTPSDSSLPSSGDWLDHTKSPPSPYPNNSPYIPNTDETSTGRDPVYNFMNYTPNMLRFTDDQYTRMKAMIKKYLPGITGYESLWHRTRERVTPAAYFHFLNSAKVYIKSGNDLIEKPFMCCHGGMCGCLHPITLDTNKIVKYSDDESEKIIKSYINMQKI